jgi:hypothetical protein
MKNLTSRIFLNPVSCLIFFLEGCVSGLLDNGFFSYLSHLTERSHDVLIANETFPLRGWKAAKATMVEKRHS